MQLDLLVGNDFRTFNEIVLLAVMSIRSPVFLCDMRFRLV